MGVFLNWQDFESESMNEKTCYNSLLICGKMAILKLNSGCKMRKRL